MSKLTAAIADTKLFSDARKVALLVRLDGLSETDRETLLGVIEQFNIAYNQALEKLSDTVRRELAAILADPTTPVTHGMEEGKDRIRQGLQVLQS